MSDIVPGTVRFRVPGNRRYVYGYPGRRSYSATRDIAQEYYNGREWVRYIPGCRFTLVERGKRK